jgi:predicted nucleic acid-binding protein
MKAVFADTFYFLALLNRADQAHALAERARPGDDAVLVTAAWVLTEVADGLAGTTGRAVVRDLIEELENDPLVDVLPPTRDLWTRGIELYSKRPDKAWSLTDCISFLVMSDRDISDALTADHHFEQAGFRALLR